MPRRVGRDLSQVNQSNVEVDSDASSQSHEANGRREPRFTEKLSLTADRDRPYLNLFVRDDIKYQKILFSHVLSPGEARRVKFIDFWEVSPGTPKSRTRQGDRDGSTDRAHYALPFNEVWYDDDATGEPADGQQDVHSYSYMRDGSMVWRVEIPATMIVLIKAEGSGS